jgi:diguanylate cyclase (GGDEF)-like protein/putative nucleotidyltransferase with HDIG domain
MRFGELPLKLRLYLCLNAVLLLPVGWVIRSTTFQVDPVQFWLLMTATAVFGMWKVELPVLTGKMTLTFAVVCLALLLQGVGPAVVCAVVGISSASFLRPAEKRLRLEWIRMPLYRWAFNVANCGIASTISGLLYSWMMTLSVDGALARILSLTGFTSVYFLINTLGVSLAIALQRGQSWFAIWKENFVWTAPGFFASAPGAMAIQLGWRLLGPWSLMFLPWAYIIFYSYKLISERDRANLSHITELNKLNQAVISSLATAIEAKDRTTSSHINRVQQYALALAKEAGVSGKMYDAVATGALVHDIGKLGIPDHILLKPGKLGAEEYRRMQRHVTIGAEILAPVQFPFPVVDVVLSHHERWDGLGYPNGLKRDEIPVGGRIISIVDVFDALTSDRPYRRAMTREQAANVLHEAAGKQFDPDLVEKFLRILPRVGAEIEAMEAEERKRIQTTRDDEEDGSALTEISQAAREMAALCDVAHALNEKESSEDVFSVVVTRALSLLPADLAVLYLRDERLPVLRAVRAEGQYSERLLGMTIEVGEGASGHVAENQQPQVNVSAALDVARRFGPGENLELSAVTAVPVLQGPENIGVLAVYTTAYSVLSAHHLNVLNILAEHAAAAIQNVRRLEQHRDLAFTDPITGLANSRELFRQLLRLRGDDSGVVTVRNFSLVMLDLDGFKAVNDRLGHLRGDELLRLVAEKLERLARKGDFVCRYAGDEFVVLLPGSDAVTAERIATRIRTEIDALGLVDGKVRIGASVGTATYPADGEEARDLIHQADTRMYADKYERKRMLSGRIRLQAERDPVPIGGG